MAFPANINLSTLDGSSGFSLRGAAAGDLAGFSVASAGDVNGDGFDDLIIGARDADPNGSNSGASYVVFGKASGFSANVDLSSLNGTTGFKLSGVGQDQRSGISVASAGDVNGDGFDDLIVGAYRASGTGIDTGAAYVVFGKASGFAVNIDLSSLDGTTGFRLSGTAVLDFAGRSVAPAGDVNGDGYDDLIVGANGADPHGNASGASYVVFGQASGFAANVDLSSLNGTTGFKLSGAAASDQSGFSVASAGDVNGDGYDDLIVGALGATPSGASSGAAYVVFGKASGFTGNLDLSTLNGTTGFKLSGSAVADVAGISVASAGDVNGDGYADLIVGAAGADTNGADSGAAYVVFGKASGFATDINLSSLDGTTGFRVSGAAAGDQAGLSVASAGDVNGDGYDDLIVGATNADPNGTSSGASYVVFGKASGFGASIDLASLDGTTGFRLDGVAASDGSGRSVAAAGDVNGDGYDDLIVGAPYADPHGSNSGASYVVFGGAFGATVTTTGTAAAEMLVGGTGDDVLTGGGGADVFQGGAGDDRLIVSDLTFHLADGGTGTDTLALSGAGQTLDLTDPLTAGRLESIERIDLTGSGNNTLKINAAAVLSGVGEVSGGRHVLTVEGNAGDMVSLADADWRKAGSFTDGSGTYDRYVLGNAEVVVEQGVTVTGPSVINLSSLSGSNGFKLDGTAAGDLTGWSVRSAGDVNGDGYDDLIIGARDADSNGNSNSGASYVVFGKASGFDANIDLSTLNGTTGFKLSGVGPDERSGISVASVGDLNGDGFDDLIVGADRASGTGTDTGAAYVVFGKASGFAASIDLASLDGATGFRLSGAGAMDFAGWSVASAGDVNGDGFDDLIVGARAADPNGADSGAAYVVFGKASGFAANIDLASLDGTTGFTLNGLGNLNRAGLSVASAGDVNGDGYDDLIVGSLNGSFVVFGKASGFAADIDLASLDGSNGFSLSGSSRFGYSTASAGDVNGDGYDDLIAGATSDPTNGAASGATYVVFGKASGFAANISVRNLNGSDGFKLYGEASDDQSGISVASAGDINGDGYDDLIVGAHGADPDGVTNAGATYIIFGKASGFAADNNLSLLNGVDGFKLIGVAPDDRSGRSVASAGDVNGDGFDDLIVGAPYADSNGTDSGASYVMFGGAFGATVTTTGTAAAEMLVGGAGDDVLTGGGGADVFQGGAGDDRLIVSDLTFHLADGGTGTDTLALSGAGLVLDLTAPLTAAKLEGIERIDLTGSGNNTLVVNAAAVLGGVGEVTGGKHILTVEGNAGDKVSFDGEAWTKIGTFTDASGTYDRYVLGNAEVRVEQGVYAPAATINLAGLDGSNGFTLSGVAPDDRSGRSVASAGDLNADGYDDLIVGVRNADPNGSDSGASYVVFGKASGFDANINLSTLDGSNGFKLSGAAADDNAGYSVASAGDLNGDGFDDLIIGAPTADPSGSNSGASYVVFGKASGFAANINLSSLSGTDGFRLVGAASGDQSGISVASAGDVNGDGYDDLIVGARLADANGSNSGASYIVFGKAPGFAANVNLASLDGTTGFRLSGVAAGDASGETVASAGDVNGDGFDDLIIGAQSDDTGGFNSGAAYVVFGKASGFAADINLGTLNGTNGFKLTGTASEQAGGSVASAGDVNGDGYADLIVGAAWNDTNGFNAGAAYVVFGKAGGFAANIDLASLNGTDGFKLIGGEASRNAGISVASAGDVNGDGYGDLIVGSSGAGSYVAFGKASGFAASMDLLSLDGATGFKLLGANGDTAGQSVAAAGDVNGDGFDDLIVGAPYADLNETNSGASYVMFGGAFGASGTPVNTVGTVAGEVLVGGNGDDVLTGGGGADVFHAGAGDDRLIVSDLTFQLADGGNGTDTLALSGVGQTLDLTNPLTAAKLESIERVDLTGSGNNTLVVNAAAVLGGVGAVEGGKHILTIEGNAGDKVSFDGEAWTKTGTITDASGTYDRFVLGNAEVRVEQGVYAPAATINLSGLDGGNGFKLSGAAAGDQSGFSVASAGDVNGDGYDDIIIGARDADPNGSNSGASYVVFGKASGHAANIDLAGLDGTTGFKLSGVGQDQRSGISVASAGDVNGDGFDDLIIGAYRASGTGVDTGAAYVVFGKASGFAANIDLSSLNGTTGFRLSGTNILDYAGFSVASAGDVNGDGFDDLIVGAKGADPNGNNSGASYVVFGTASGFTANIDLSSLDGSTGFKLSGAVSDDNAGSSVASAGDVNGDGYDDLIVGASRADENGQNSGASYVVFGKASGFAANIDLSTLNGSNGFKLGGAAAQDQSGISVASAGDINGDGYDDLIVGAPAADPNGGFSGASYVVFGKASGFAATLNLSTLDGTTGFRVSGAAASDFSGSSVASAGDINGDGYDDLIVGAHGADPGGVASAGATYIIFGKASGFAADINLSSLNGTDGFELIGVAAVDRGGLSVASAGDVNGDGYDDLVIGAPYADPNGSNSGASYVVFGGAFGGTVTTTGTSAAEMLIGGTGDDVLTGGGGADVFHAGAGSDRLVVSDLTFRLADGGTGTDTLALGGAGLVLDLTTALMADKLEGIERIDLTALGANTLKINSAAVLGGVGAVTGGKHVLTVLGTADDKVQLVGAGWSKTGSFDEGGVLFDRWVLGNALVDVQQGVGFGIAIAGSPGADWLIGTDGDDFLDGGTGDDTLLGEGGTDTLVGGAGADLMTGGSGNDTYGVTDAGDVVVEAAGGGIDTVNTTLSSYTLGADVENLTFFGTGGFTGTGNEVSNRLTGGTGADTLDGGAGNDTLVGGAGADLMTGGSGNDTYGVTDAGDVVVELVGGGTDTVNTTLSSYTLGADVENLTFFGTGSFTGTGNELSNRLTGGTGADTLDGGAGDDTLIAGAGADLMIGGSGNDTYGVTDAGDVVVELVGGGVDTVNTTLSSYTLGANVENLTFFATGSFTGTGNELSNRLTGGTGDDTLLGEGGNDTLVGGAGADLMTGGSGNDTYGVTDAGDVVVEAAGGGIDTVNTTLSSYTLGADVENLTFFATGSFTGTGNELSNVLIGGAGDDTLLGEGGNDTLVGGAGADLMTGGSGNDTYGVTDAGDVVVEAAGGGIDTVNTTLSSYTLGADVENLTFFGTGGFTGTGNEVSNRLTGGTGADTLDGGAGNDTLVGGAGADLMIGGSGNDTYGVTDAGDVVVELVGGGVDTVNTTLSSYTLGANVENLTFFATGSFTGTGNELSNRLTGGTGDDTLDGGAGDDTLIAGAGADLMIGGSGNDTYGVTDAGDVVVELVGGGVDTVNTTLSSYTLGANVENLTFFATGSFTGTGNELANVLIGGDGDDTLDGGAGGDLLIGGAGADVFVFGDALDSTHVARDMIGDFTVGTDRIDFTQMLSGGGFHALQTVTSAPTTIDAHSLVALVGANGDTVLYVNDTGVAQATNSASMEILLKGVTTLGDADLGYFLI